MCARQTPPWQADTPPSWADTPDPLAGRHPLGRHLPSRDGHCSGRYASYWNAFLFYTIVIQIIEIEQFSTAQYRLVELDRPVSLHKSKDVQQGDPKILILVKVCGIQCIFV